MGHFVSSCFCGLFVDVVYKKGFHSLDLLGLTKTTDRRSEDSSRVGGKNVGAAGDGLFASLAAPDADAGSLHGFLWEKV